MSKSVEVKVEKDHLLSLTKATGITAISELIWNSLDADAKKIEIKLQGNEIFYDRIIVLDDGHGLDYDSAVAAFQSLGGSNKKFKLFSEEHRALHGREGKGRLKAFSLGEIITFESVYYDEPRKRYNSFYIKIDKAFIQRVEISDVEENVKATKSSFKVTIENVDQEVAHQIESGRGLSDLEEKFAVYSMAYPNFLISINGTRLNFSKQITDTFTDSFTYYSTAQEEVKEIDVKIKIITWRQERDRRLYLCSASGISYSEEPLLLRTHGLNLTVYLLADYFEDLHKASRLDLRNSEEDFKAILERAKEIVRKNIRDRKHAEASNYIEVLKKENVYPFTEEPKDEIEKVNRQVFDIVALQINDHLEEFNDQTQKSKKLTLTLIKEALEKDSSSLPHILEEVIQLPKEKQDDLKDLLEKTSLSVIIDVMKAITDRLRIVYELKLLLFDKSVNSFVKERKHLHKIVKEETWLFGDDFTYGADDVTLRNVLKAYLSHLGREGFEENNVDGSLLIPDICLWKQYNSGRAGHFHNLVIELKRPTKTIGSEEIAQIKKYAFNVIDDERFPKDKTEWTFILLSTKMDKYAENDCNQTDRSYGHISAQGNVNVFVKKWGDLLNEAESRHQYLKEKLNYNISEDKEGIKLLKKKYLKYLPSEITSEQEEIEEVQSEVAEVNK